MVWGMVLPSGFGEFWPDGDFEGETKDGGSKWGARLEDHFLKQSPEEQRRLLDHSSASTPLGARDYSFFVANKFTLEIGGIRYPELPPATRVEAFEAPTSFVTLKTYQSLAALIKLNSRLIAVEGRVRTIIEELEPGVHQFFPISIQMPKGHTYPSDYFTLVIGRYFDSFVPSESKAEAWSMNGDFRIQIVERVKEMSGLAFSSAIVGQAHLWRERRMGESLTLFSDEMKSKLDQAELRLPKMVRMKTI